MNEPDPDMFRPLQIEGFTLPARDVPAYMTEFGERYREYVPTWRTAITMMIAIVVVALEVWLSMRARWKPGWIMLLISMTFIALLLANIRFGLAQSRKLHRRMLFDHGFPICIECGYDLHGSGINNVCPECGWRRG